MRPDDSAGGNSKYVILGLTTSVLVTERNVIPVCETAESMPNRRKL